MKEKDLYEEGTECRVWERWEKRKPAGWIMVSFPFLWVISVPQRSCVSHLSYGLDEKRKTQRRTR